MTDNQPRMRYLVVIRHRNNDKVIDTKVIDAVSAGEAKQLHCEYWFGYKTWKENRAELKARELLVNARRI